MKGILRYLRDYKKESVLAPLFKMLEACFELLIPIVMAHIIDTGIKNQDMGYVLRMCLVMIALGIIGLSCSLTAQYFSAKAATGFGTALRSDLFRHITSLSYNEIDTIGTSTLLTRMTSDINQIQTGVNLTFSVYRIRCDDHVIYDRCQISHDLCGYNTGIVDRCIRNYACQHSIV
mgnify:CR=1 FL=1